MYIYIYYLLSLFILAHYSLHQGGFWQPGTKIFTLLSIVNEIKNYIYKKSNKNFPTPNHIFSL